MSGSGSLSLFRLAARAAVRLPMARWCQVGSTLGVFVICLVTAGLGAAWQQYDHRAAQSAARTPIYGQGGTGTR
ncbi:MAG: hypothetical protein ACRC0L_04550, partial [Angustibacter sp.]